MKFLDRLALAVQRHEGWYPTSLAFRNNNPGNLRYRAFHKEFYKAVVGDGSFAKFPNYKVGFRALKDDLATKICGGSDHIDYSNNPTFLDMMKVYAPSEDNNDPNSYTQSLIRQLKEFDLNKDTLLSHMAQYISQSPSNESKPLPSVPPLRTLEAVRRGIKRATQRGLVMVTNRLIRLENRLLD
tara:strand:+ start:3412 stop:3963 length:552 start_codon:yes stop_codon:yes gene_type:complete